MAARMGAFAPSMPIGGETLGSVALFCSVPLCEPQLLYLLVIASLCAAHMEWLPIWVISAVPGLYFATVSHDRTGQGRRGGPAASIDSAAQGLSATVNVFLLAMAVAAGMPAASKLIDMDVLGAAEDWLRVWPFLLLGLLKVVAESRLEVAVPELMEQVAGYYREGADFSITWFAFLKSVVTGKRGERDNRLKKR